MGHINHEIREKRKNGLKYISPFEKGGKGGISFWVCFGKIMVAGFLALAYNLVWGLPFAEFFKLSNYENGASHYQDLGLLDFGTLFSPFDQGHPLFAGYHGPHYWVSTYYVGLVTLCLLLWGAIRLAYRKTSWAISILLLALSLGALGLDSGLRSFFPGFSLVIHSGYWLAPLLFWLAWMAMEALEDFLGQTPKFKKKGIWVGIVFAVFAVSSLVSFFTWASFSTSDRGVWICSFGFAVAAAFFVSPLLRWGAILASLALSLGWEASGINILLDRSYYEKPPSVLAALPKPGRIFFTPPLLLEAKVLQGNDMEQAYETAKQKLYPNWPLGFGREESPIYNTLQLKSTFDWTFKVFQYSLKQSRNATDYLGIRYVFGKATFKDFKKIDAGGVAEAYENPTPLPKWYSVLRAEGIWTKRKSGTLNYGQECLIANPDHSGDYHPRRVDAKSWKPNGLEIVAEGKGKALVVSSETAYPGWRASVNGHERPLETVNQCFRGIVLNDGETKASLAFEPTTFRLGLFIALTVCGFWILKLFQALKELFIKAH